MKVKSLALILCVLLTVTGCFGKKNTTNELKYYTVTFTNTGQTTVSTQIIKEGNTASIPTDPIREGYLFDGWYINLTDTNPYDFNTKVKQDITLKAKWSVSTVKSEDDLDSTDNSNDTNTSKQNTSSNSTGTSSNTNKSNSSTNSSKTNNSSTSKPSASTTPSKSSEPVNVSVSGISLNTTSLSIDYGKNSTIIATVSPSNATNKAVNWSSKDSNIASVDANGNVTAKKVGETTITVTTEDGSKSASCKVVVKETYSYKWDNSRQDTFGRQDLYIIADSTKSPVNGKVVYVYKDEPDNRITASIPATGQLLPVNDINIISVTNA